MPTDVVRDPRPRRRRMLRLAYLTVVAAGLVLWLMHMDGGRRRPRSIAAVASAPGQSTPEGAANGGGAAGGNANRAKTGRSPMKLNTGTVPLPRALAAFDEQERVEPTKLFEAEKRHPVWAPQMEATITGAIRQMIQKHGFEHTELAAECRESTCRLQFKFDRDDLFRSQDQGAPNPQVAMVRDSGMWSAVMHEVPVEGKPVVMPDLSVAAESDGSFTKTMILLFGEDEIDPASYEGWSARQAEEARQLQAQRQAPVDEGRR